MAETATNRRVCKALAGLHPIRVENPACAGTPDVNFSGGWIENKQLADWPKRPDTIVRIDHFSPQQRVWHTQREHAGGDSWVFVQVGREYLLFYGETAARVLGTLTRQQMYEMAIGVWKNGLNDAEFRNLVTGK